MDNLTCSLPEHATLHSMKYIVSLSPKSFIIRIVFIIGSVFALSNPVFAGTVTGYGPSSTGGMQTFTVSDCVIQANQSTCSASLSYSAGTQNVYIGNSTTGRGAYNLSSIDLTYGSNAVGVGPGGSNPQLVTIATATCAPGSTWLISDSQGKCFDGSVTATTQSGSISFDLFTGCVIMDNSSTCNMTVPQQPGRPNTEFTIGGTYQSKNTTGDYLIVKNLNDNFPTAVQDNRLHWNAILPSNGSLGTFSPRPVSQPIALTHGVNTIVFTKPDGTEVSRQNVQATCNSTSEWKVNTQSYVNSNGIYSQGSCVPKAQTTGAQVASFTVSDCVIALGDSACEAKIEANSSAGRQLRAWYTNEDAIKNSFPPLQWVIGETGEDIYNKGAKGAQLTPNSTDPTKYSFVGDSTEFMGIRANSRLDRVNVGTGYSQRITYGLNKFTLYESMGTYSNDAKIVGTATARATCAPGSVWTMFDWGSNKAGSNSFYEPISQDYKCAAPIVPGATGVQKRKLADVGWKDFGTIKGFCPVGEKWQPNSGSLNYSCQPNIDPIDTSKLQVTIDTTPGYQFAYGESACSKPLVRTDCHAVFQITAPAERTFSLYRVSEPMYENKDGIMGRLQDITQMSYEDPSYGGSQGGRDSKGPIVILYTNKPNVYEVRLGSTVLATVTATASTEGIVPCNGVSNCVKYKWNITTTKGGVTTTNTVAATNTNINTSSLPSGCTSSTTFSPTTGQRCVSGTTTTTNNGSSSLSPTNLSVSQVAKDLKGVILKWTAPSASLARYKVSYVEYIGGVAQAKKLVAFLTPTATDYFISPLTAGNRYDLYLSAVDTAGNESPESSITGVYLTPSTSTTNTSSTQGDIDPNGTQGNMCLSLSADLRQGTRNDAVYSLQDFLINANYLNAEATGYFGALTFKAVQSYQASKNLTSSGFVGPLTRAAIQKDSCGS